MDESDSDAEPSRAAPADPDDEDRFPVDGLYASEVEKAQINAMRDLEREQILTERRDQIERHRQNRLLRQMVNNFEDQERKQVGKKRSADTAELGEDGGRKSKTRGGKPTAMDALRRARAEKQRRKEDKDKRKGDYSPGREDSDASAVSDRGYSPARSRTPEVEREAPPAELRDYNRVQLGRNEFAQVCSTPGFESAITGCFVRLALGPHPETGIEQYRMGVIKGEQPCPCFLDRF